MPSTRAWWLRAIAVGAAALLVAAASLRVWQDVQRPSCVGVCGVLVQARAWSAGVPVWESAGLGRLDPACPRVAATMYQPTALAVLGSVTRGVDPAVVCAGWSSAMAVLWAGVVALVVSIARGRAVRLLVALAVVLRGLGDPLYHDLTATNFSVVEALLVWGALALGHRDRWVGAAGLLLVAGLLKPVFWALLPLVAVVGRPRPFVAAAAGAAAWVAWAWVWTPEAAAHVWHDARVHDERGVVHPSLRSLVRDVAGAPVAEAHVGDAVWIAVCVAVAVGLAVWVRRAPGRGASADGLVAVLLGYLAITPYLKDYGLVLALPAVAWVVARLPLGAGAVLAVLAVVPGVLGAYQPLATLWAALAGIVVVVRRDALAPSPNPPAAG